MMMMSAPSSSFHDYLAMDSSLTKLEAMSPLQTTEDPFGDTFDQTQQNSHNFRNNRNSVVKRPMNAFLLWARGERKRVSSDGYGVSQTSLSKLLGETWRHMSLDEKQPFLDMAETLKRQHHIDHPDYKFKPKQRSAIGAKGTAKKNHSFQRQLSTMLSSPHCTSFSSQSSLATISNVNPHPVQSNVLAMCQAIIPSSLPSSSADTADDWFLQLTEQAQSVIVAPSPRTQASPVSSRRAVRIQIINKHDDIALPPPTLLPMTPPPLSSSSSLVSDESTPTLIEYLVNSCNIFNIPTHSNHHHHHHHHHQQQQQQQQQQQALASEMDDPTDYETVYDSSINHFTELDEHYDSSGWIDTPLSNFGTNSTDMVPSSPYTSYDFLCL